MWRSLIGNFIFFPAYVFVANYIILRLVPKTASIFISGLKLENLPDLKQIFRSSLYIGMICAITSDILFLLIIAIAKGTH